MNAPSDTLIHDMATALQKAVAMYFLLHDHAAGRTDLTEDQLAAVVEGVCDEARETLERAREAGLVPPVLTCAPRGRAHDDPVSVLTVDRPDGGWIQ